MSFKIPFIGISRGELRRCKLFKKLVLNDFKKYNRKWGLSFHNEVY